MSETENEYGCVRCQAWHGESDGPVYAEHIMHQSKHGLRRRPEGGWPVPQSGEQALTPEQERRRAFRASLRTGGGDGGKRP